jgi:hypothetical protein
VGSNPTQGVDVWCMYAFILCLGRGLATGLSLVQGVLPSALNGLKEPLKKKTYTSGRVFSFKMHIAILMPKIQTEHDPELVPSTPILFIFLNIDLLLGPPSGCFP